MLLVGLLRYFSIPSRATSPTAHRTSSIAAASLSARRSPCAVLPRVINPVTATNHYSLQRWDVTISSSRLDLHQEGADRTAAARPAGHAASGSPLRSRASK